MNVEDLIAILKQYPKDALVLLSSDEEGNGYQRLYDLSSHYMSSDSTYEIDIYEPEDLDDGDGIPAGFERVVVLWP